MLRLSLRLLVRCWLCAPDERENRTAAAMGRVKVRLLSYMKGARMKIDRMAGKVVEMIDSASRFVVM